MTIKPGTVVECWDTNSEYPQLGYYVSGRPGRHFILYSSDQSEPSAYHHAKPIPTTPELPFPVGTKCLAPELTGQEPVTFRGTVYDGVSRYLIRADNGTLHVVTNVEPVAKPTTAESLVTLWRDNSVSYTSISILSDNIAADVEYDCDLETTTCTFTDESILVFDGKAHELWRVV